VLADPRRKTENGSRRITITPLRGEDAFLEVLRAAFNLIRVDRARLANHFAIASKLAGDIPIRRLAFPRGIRRLGGVCDAVVADATALRRTQSRTGTAD
jgi:hypothetical protein